MNRRTRYRATMPKLDPKQEKCDFVAAARSPNGARMEVSGHITQEQSDRLMAFTVDLINEGKRK